MEMIQMQMRNGSRDRALERKEKAEQRKEKVSDRKQTNDKILAIAT